MSLLYKKNPDSSYYWIFNGREIAPPQELASTKEASVLPFQRILSEDTIIFVLMKAGMYDI
jgi:hypothetical protein